MDAPIAALTVASKGCVPGNAPTNWASAGAAKTKPNALKRMRRSRKIPKANNKHATRPTSQRSTVLLMKALRALKS